MREAPGWYRASHPWAKSKVPSCPLWHQGPKMDLWVRFLPWPRDPAGQGCIVALIAVSCTDTAPSGRCLHDPFPTPHTEDGTATRRVPKASCTFDPAVSGIAQLCMMEKQGRMVSVFWSNLEHPYQNKGVGKRKHP